MEIGKLGTGSLFQSGLSGIRPPIHTETQKALDAAKQNLAEVLGAVQPNQVKIGGIPDPKAISDPVRVEKPVEDFVNWVDDKQHIAQETTFDVLSGKSDNLHQSVLATQEAGIAFTLLLEVRNKLVDGFRELTRMSI